MTYKPPMIDGVSASKLYLPKTAGVVSVFEYLCQKFCHITPDEWRSRMSAAQVLFDDGSIIHEHTAYQQGRSLFYYRMLDEEVVVPFELVVLYEDDELMVVDKPHFLAVTPAGRHVKQTVLSRLKNITGNDELSPIHRLDRETAGVMLISKNAQTRHAYQSLFAECAIAKTYHAIAPLPKHHLPKDIHLHIRRAEVFYTMQVDSSLPPNSHTSIKLMAQSASWGKYELRPSTGKLHQLRVHMNHLGIPIKDDAFYPVIRHKPADDFGSPLQLLAKSLAFKDPISRRQMSFESVQDLYLPI